MFFRESIGRIQVVLFICLAIGLILFFLSAFSWSCYALLQNPLGTKLASPNILLIIYFLASIALWPVSNVRAFQYLGTEQWTLLIFLALNTLIAYGSFAQAMKYWSAVNVSTFISLGPLATFAAIAAQIWSGEISSEALTTPTTTGIMLIIMSAIGIQVFRPKARPETEYNEVNTKTHSVFQSRM